MVLYVGKALGKPELYLNQILALCITQSLNRGQVRVSKGA